jgi:hypothetical protein
LKGIAMLLEMKLQLQHGKKLEFQQIGYLIYLKNTIGGVLVL